MKRRDFIIGGAAVAWPVMAIAQQSQRVARIGFLGAASATGYASRVQAFLAGLAELGYVERKNLTVELRWAEGKYERLPELAAQLAALKVDVLVTHGTPGTLAAKRTATNVPIVMAVVGDAVATGLVSELARPGGNLTGSTFFNPELVTKRLELIKELVPSATKVGFLFNADNLSDRLLLERAETTGKALKIGIQAIAIRSSNELPGILSAASRSQIDALSTTDDGIFVANAKTIAEIAMKNRIPSSGFKELVQAGGLISYGPDIAALFRRAAVFVDKILKGAKPGDIPIEHPTKFELVVNLKTAKAIGLEVPSSFYWRADEVIE